MANCFLIDFKHVEDEPSEVTVPKLETKVNIKRDDDSPRNACSTVLIPEQVIQNLIVSDPRTLDRAEVSSNEDIDITGNVILFGDWVTELNEIESEQDNTSSLDEGTILTVIENGAGKVKGKRKNKTELDWLTMDKKDSDEDLDGTFDVYGDEKRIFRKYKLRKTERKTEPMLNKKPEAIARKPSISTDDEPDSTCSICNQEFETKVALRNHLRILHKNSVRQYICSLCFTKFQKNADLIAHRQQHSEESFLCQECKMAFSNYCDFLIHNYEHLDQPYFRCSECGVRYRKSIYKLHVKTHFEKNFTCDLCPFVTSQEYDLRFHMKQHKLEKTCAECGKKFNHKKDFEYHMTKHTGVKKYQCLYCGACFRHPNTRRVHQRSHTGEKPYTCEIYGDKFRQPTDMNRHRETHGTRKQYMCDICGRKFLHKFYISVHMRTHTKKSPYVCPVRLSV